MSFPAGFARLLLSTPLQRFFYTKVSFSFLLFFSYLGVRKQGVSGGHVASCKRFALVCLASFPEPGVAVDGLEKTSRC